MLEAAARLAGLGGVCLIEDQGEPFSGQCAHLVRDDGKFLEVIFVRVQGALFFGRDHYIIDIVFAQQAVGNGIALIYLLYLVRSKPSHS